MSVKDSMKTLLKKYNRYEADNNHNEAALLLITTFGTEDEKAEMLNIIHRHKRDGHINNSDYRKRYDMSQKYYNLLTKLK